jgi:hypothetical protein
MNLKKLRLILWMYVAFDLFIGGTCGGLLPLTPMAAAQFTTVTGTVVDPNGLPYANGTITPLLVVPSGAGSPTLGGLPYTPPTSSIGLDLTGSFSFNVADNTQLLPAATKWSFTVCSALGTVLPAGGKGPICFIVPALTVSGASQSISAAIAAVPPPALALSGGGSGTSPTQPAFLVTASPYLAKCDGLNDDTTAIQSAITAASAAHGTVIFPQGTCKITSALTVAAGTLTLGLQGQINNSSIIMQATAGADYLDVNGTVGSPVNTLTINNLIFERSVAFTGTPKGLNFNFCLNCNLLYVQVFDSFQNYFTIGGSNDTWTYVSSVGNNSTVNTGYAISGQTLSLFLENALAAGNHTTGLAFISSAVDTFAYHFSSTSAVATAVSIPVPASNVHFHQPILDQCSTACFNITNSTAGVNGNDNNIEILDCWCNAGSGANFALNITTVNGVLVTDGTYITNKSGTAAISGTTVGRSRIVGAKILVQAGTNTADCIGITSLTDSVVSNNTCFAPTATPFLTAYSFASGTFNTISNNSASGKGTTGFVFDAATVNNSVCANNVDTTNITTKITNTGGASNVCGLTN